MRPFIKLELIETDLLEAPEPRDIRSFVTELTQEGKIITGFPCATVVSTQAEKLVAIMRRTAAAMRHVERKDDESLNSSLYS
ncbi:nucleotidyl transferase AbiEii/AbiGii toxin family protein [Photorhabdus heterorhabditis]|uniref:Nucleotidyl transferase AbiEii/AbiGii toxin family protein n=1 Tax=Photorhabdus heterorhabditis TaxID=880156 RepID=A0A5B0WLU6_9GAMM|nr:nucleotidyl transferase AbiEii/AbiGii toxin family protein [Photorhabdus heterorhabditis]KAA1188014.1 nucleotidyl transferase AbiEii/AbiGii toxin family protein [Photorhabdus heterorhabditis]